jgi:hypothetical protein
LLEAEIACDVVADDARVRESGSAKAGMDLVRDRATPDFAASLEDQRLVARACETGAATRPLWPAPMMTGLMRGPAERREPRSARARP